MTASDWAVGDLQVRALPRRRRHRYANTHGYSRCSQIFTILTNIHGYSRILTNIHGYSRPAHNQRGPRARNAHLGPYYSGSALMGTIWSLPHCDHTARTELGAATRFAVVFQPWPGERCPSGLFSCPPRHHATACMRAPSGPWVLVGLSAKKAG